MCEGGTKGLCFDWEGSGESIGEGESCCRGSGSSGGSPGSGGLSIFDLREYYNGWARGVM